MATGSHDLQVGEPHIGEQWLLRTLLPELIVVGEEKQFPAKGGEIARLGIGCCGAGIALPEVFGKRLYRFVVEVDAEGIEDVDMKQ